MWFINSRRGRRIRPKRGQTKRPTETHRTVIPNPIKPCLNQTKTPFNLRSKKPSVDSDQKPKRFRRTKQQMLEDSARAADDAVSSILSRSTVEVKVEKRGRKESPFMRECLICKSRMHQDKLAEHYTKHFFSSAKCCKCRKSPTNPANFVTHILSHLRMSFIIKLVFQLFLNVYFFLFLASQFFCQQCDKWFRKPLVFSRHQGECLKRQDKSSLGINIILL